MQYRYFCKVTQTSYLNLGCDARIYAIFRLCLKLCFPHPFSGTVPTYMLLVAVLGSKRPRQVPTATCVPYKGCGKYSLFHNIEIAYILAISFISKCEVRVPYINSHFLNSYLKLGFTNLEVLVLILYNSENRRLSHDYIITSLIY